MTAPSVERLPRERRLLRLDIPARSLEEEPQVGGEEQNREEGEPSADVHSTRAHRNHETSGATQEANAVDGVEQGTERSPRQRQVRKCRPAPVTVVIWQSLAFAICQRACCASHVDVRVFRSSVLRCRTDLQESSFRDVAPDRAKLCQIYSRYIWRKACSCDELKRHGDTGDDIWNAVAATWRVVVMT
ncbi:hypothetical protein [Bradyrhizobium sp.]|uniref:hypothetical protein n=1 Tax=Bradyrhizobium sp. TaxID=376 RepID=UPI0039E63E92